MERISGDLGEDYRADSLEGVPAMPLPAGDEPLLEACSGGREPPERLFHLDQIDVHYDERQKVLWSFLRPSSRPSFTIQMLRDLESWQLLTAGHFGPSRLPLDFLVLGCRTPGVFSFGGDLELFQSLIRSGNREALTTYAHLCVEVVHRSHRALDLPIITIGLAQGQALGGGFEALLSFDVIIAEKTAVFGLPETMFGLFPGMGAHSLLTRKLGTAMAERLILSNRNYTAHEMYDMGIVTQLAEPGEGLAATREFIAKAQRRHAGLVAAKQAARLASPIALQEMRDIVDLWVDAALRLSDADLKLMARLAGMQARHRLSAA